MTGDNLMAEDKKISKGDIVSLIETSQDVDAFREQNWEGNYEEYLEIVRQNPKVARTAFQRLYDMILSHGTEDYTELREKLVCYTFFKDGEFEGEDAVYGLERPLMKLVDIFKAAAQRYGTEKQGCSVLENRDII